MVVVFSSPSPPPHPLGIKSMEEQMKIANKPLDHLNTTGRDTSNSDLKNKSEEDLKGLIIQLRAQLQHLVQAKECAMQPGGMELALAEQEFAKDPDLILPVHAEAELLKVAVKDTATQTALVPSSTMKHEGKATTSDDKARRLKLSEEWVLHQQRAFPKNESREISLRTSRINKVRFQFSHFFCVGTGSKCKKNVGLYGHWNGL